MQNNQHFLKEQAATEWLAKMRWGGHNNAVCQHCGHKHCYKHKNIDRYTCKSCGKQFSVRKNTLFASGRVPLFKWFLAMEVFNSGIGMVSSPSLAKQIGVGQKTAWKMLSVLRAASPKYKKFQEAKKLAKEMKNSKQEVRKLVKEIQEIAAML